MSMKTREFSISTDHEGMYNITARLREVIRESGVQSGLAVVYAAGMIYYYVICNYVLNTPIAVGPLFLYCFVLAVPGDTALSVLGAVLIKRLAPLLERSGIWTVSGTPNIPQAATAARS
jgi:hypothetical protein